MCDGGISAPYRADSIVRWVEVLRIVQRHDPLHKSNNALVVARKHSGVIKKLLQHLMVRLETFGGEE
jgi:hypothetical protein